MASRWLLMVDNVDVEEMLFGTPDGVRGMTGLPVSNQLSVKRVTSGRKQAMICTIRFHTSPPPSTYRSHIKRDKRGRRN